MKLDGVVHFVTAFTRSHVASSLRALYTRTHKAIAWLKMLAQDIVIWGKG